MRTLMIAAILVASLRQPVLATCVNGGTSATLQAELDAGRDAVLCPSSVFNLTQTVTYKFANQQIYTEGSPTGSTRALLKVAASSLVTAVRGNNLNGVQLRSVRIDGRRPTYGVVTQGAELLDFGGNSSGQVVSEVEAFEPRGWTVLHFFEGGATFNGTAWTGGCTGGRVVNNYFHDAGQHATSQWADGISFACRNGYVANNTVANATDGGIVVFGAPGTVVEYNTVSNTTRVGLGGINLVDGGPFKRNVTINGVATLVNDFSGTIVRLNTVDSGPGAGGQAYIQIGLAMGTRPWWCVPPSDQASIVYGGTVTNNTLQGWNFGYMYVVDGVDSWTVTGNINNGNTPWFAPNTCDGSANAFPTLFLKHSAHITGNSNIQSTFYSSLYGGYFAVTEGQGHGLLRNP